MAEAPKKPKKKPNSQQQIDELTHDLQRTRADFENYRKRVDIEKQMAREMGQVSAITKLLPTIDNIERAIAYLPEDLKDNTWARGVVGLTNSLEKSLSDMGVARIEARPGTPFDPELHEAIQFDEAASGDNEVIAEELQAGYTLDGAVIRHAMVKVTKQ